MGSGPFNQMNRRRPLEQTAMRVSRYIRASFASVRRRGRNEDQRVRQWKPLPLATPPSWSVGEPSARCRLASHCGKVFLAAWLSLCLITNARAEDPTSGNARSLADLSLEQLMNESVTSVSKKETRLNQSPAAISVITQEDIRRSGLTTLPELLRTVPGMDVARIDSHEWAVSSRGFNGEFGNKLLVLIDGRTIYTPASGGVFWNAQDVVLEDLDRIEVIRGPGATLWGANAVNGVINITTKSAKETQDGLVSVSAGTEDHPSTTVRYGGQIANVYYRAYVKYLNREGLVDSNGKETPDEWSAIRGGFRTDWEPSTENTFTLQGDFYSSEAGKNIVTPVLAAPFTRSDNVVEHNNGQNILGRWTHTFSEASQFSLQAYYDRFKESDGVTIETRDTYDVDLQHRFPLGARNDVVWGVGYRNALVEHTSTPRFIWNPAGVKIDLFNIFIQDDITLVEKRLHFIFGSKFEHNGLVGWEPQPSGRLLWTPTEQQTVWASVSRATRTPSLFERDSRLDVAAFQPNAFSPLFLVSQFGNHRADSEKLTAYELGYRIESAKRLSFDLTGFYNVYDDLLITVPNANRFEANPSPAHVLISSISQNAQAGETFGTELAANCQVNDHWRLTGSYTWRHMCLHPDNSAESDSPQQQFQIRSYLDLTHNVELNGALYFVDQIKPQFAGTRLPVSSYVRLDIGLAWRPTKSLELGVWGQNLLDNQHAEFGSLQTQIRTEVPRSVLGKMTWRF